MFKELIFFLICFILLLMCLVAFFISEQNTADIYEHAILGPAY